MKIGIMGTHCVGKSNLALRMAIDSKHDHPDKKTGLLHEVARGCPLLINQETSVEAQLWIYHSQFAAEIEMLAEYDILVCDRTVLDPVVYAEVAGLKQLRKELLPGAISWMATYNEIYWLRPWREGLEDDGFRDLDPAFQAEVDAVFRAWIRGYGLKVTWFRNNKGQGGELCI